MEGLPADTIASIVSGLGTSAIFLYLYWQRDKDVKNKDKYIKEIIKDTAENNKHIETAIQNNTTAIELNTMVQDKLLSRIDDFLLRDK